MGIQILNQLKIAHQICIHNDIKPDNIMKRGEIICEYFLIDWGGATTKKLGYGYERRVWSPKWTSQPMNQPEQLTTAVNDFIELGFTMQAIQNIRKGLPNKQNLFQYNFKGKIKTYMQRINSINRKNIVARDYDDLISILK